MAGLRQSDYDVTVFAPGAINRNVEPRAGVTVRAWTKAGARRKGLRRIRRWTAYTIDIRRVEVSER